MAKLPVCPWDSVLWWSLVVDVYVLIKGIGVTHLSAILLLDSVYIQ